jgi:anti-sigma factor (TIGR02949 family)
MSDNELRCEEVERAIPWLLDDELDPEYDLEVEAHLEKCDACRHQLESEGRLRNALRSAARSINAPSSLRRRLTEAIETERRRSTPSFTRYWPAAAAAAILLAFAIKGATGGADAELEQAAVRHAGDLPMDVVGADATQVQRYLSGKLPFAVQLPAFPRSDKLGGRVTHLGDREAAYVRYDTPSGRVSVFVYQDPGYTALDGPLYDVGGNRVLVRRVRGYPAALWRSHGIVHSVVADLPEREFQTVLTSFVEASGPSLR